MLVESLESRRLLSASCPNPSGNSPNENASPIAEEAACNGAEVSEQAQDGTRGEDVSEVASAGHSQAGEDHGGGNNV